MEPCATATAVSARPRPEEQATAARRAPPCSSCHFLSGYPLAISGYPLANGRLCRRVQHKLSAMLPGGPPLPQAREGSPDPDRPGQDQGGPEGRDGTDQKQQHPVSQGFITAGEAQRAHAVRNRENYQDDKPADHIGFTRWPGGGHKRN